MENKEKLQLMLRRFVHPQSTFAEQKYYAEDFTTGTGRTMNKGTYFFPARKGECNHTPKHTKQRECDGFKDVPFTEKHLLEHLNGKATYAPYQISKDDKVKWVCLDVDAYDAPEDKIREKTVEVVRRIQQLVGPRHALVEHSGSKGYHVWVFFDEPVPVTLAFAFGHMVVNKLGNDQSLIVEVYPKQQSSRVLGNTVKLPLGVHQKTGERCWFVNSQFEKHEDQWKALAEVKTVSADWLEKNVDPSFIKEETDEEDTGRLRYVPVCLQEILDEGCGEGIRDEAAFRLSCYLRDKGLSEHYGTLVIEDWNKRNKPPLEDDVLQTKIESGYGRSYPWRPCMVPGFDAHCRSSCDFFKGKVKQRWFAKDKSPIGVISRD